MDTMSKASFGEIGKFMKLVKFSHTIFALPFALIGFFLAIKLSGNDFSLRLLGLILLAMVFARNSAMGFNRYLDRDIDAKNPRTSLREIPAGHLSPMAVKFFVIINVLLFLAVAFLINRLCFYLAFPAMAILLSYSYMKRFTSLCHYVLGLALAIAPVGAYLSIAGEFHPAPLILSLIVLLWASGFDIIYSLADEEFDKEQKLHSVPQLWGKKTGLVISAVGHALIIPNSSLHTTSKSMKLNMSMMVLEPIFLPMKSSILSKLRAIFVLSIGLGYTSLISPTTVAPVISCNIIAALFKA